MSDIKDTNYISSNFITDIVDKDLSENKNNGKVITRFPPEPNGYLHIGHAKSICLNFGIAKKYNGQCHLRFDDTNPSKEETEFVESIKEDVKWLGFDWGQNLFFASDYFDKMYEYAVILIKKGRAYVDHLNAEEIRNHRGTLTSPGKNSPYRDRTIEENLSLFEKMKNGDFKDGECVLRAKIDMSAPNINLRDPVMYRIQHAEHHNTGNKWCIYPMYDWAHGIEDSLENITHSICTLEFEDHRPLYDWFLEQIGDDIHHPQQIEFARLNITYTVMSKRKLKQLVEEKYVTGWNDPRMPTISGMRRRGYPSSSIRKFADAIGVAKSNSIVDYEYLEYFVREDLNENAPRAMVILDPLKVIVTNYPEDKEEWFEAKNHPNREDLGNRNLPFTKELYIERDDFMENPPPKFHRLFKGAEVRFQHAYHLICTGFLKDEYTGEIKEVYCEYIPETKGGWVPDRKVKGTIHWLSVKYAKSAEVRLYEKLFTKPNPDDVEEGKTYLDNLNPNSLIINKNVYIEPSLAEAENNTKYQFIRHGYFNKDSSSTSENNIFNRIVSLKDSYKI